MKLHFYKCGRQPVEAHRYYCHSSGLAGFLAPQDRRNYVGYMTIEEVEKEMPYEGVKTSVGRRKRVNVTRSFNSRH